MNSNLSALFVKSIYGLIKINYPEHLVQQTKRCLLDYLGATIAGSRIIEAKANSLLNDVSDSSNCSTVIGFKRKASVENSILLNGLSSHAAEMDDGVRYGMIHPGAPIFSALLPVAETENITPKDFIKGIIIGYEASVRLAIAIQPEHYNKGYHPTASCGTIGAAMGIAAMLGFNLKQMHDTFSAAAVSAFGTLKVIEDTSEIKPLNVARASLNGYLASRMGRSGFSGPLDVLGGEFGFLNLMTKHFDESKLFKSPTDPYAIEMVYHKPYAACRHAHAAIESSLSLREDLNVKMDDIKSIKLKTYKSNIGKHDSKEIHGIASAKMSIPFSIALALVNGKPEINDYSDLNIKNKSIINILKTIEIEVDESLTTLVPDKRPAIIEIETSNGRQFTKRTDFPKGEPENPMTDDELQQKFIELAVFGGYNIDTAKNIIGIVDEFYDKGFELFKYL